MENDRNDKAKQNKEYADASKGVDIKDKPSIFSQKQINAIVKEFITAYIRGNIKIKLKDATEYFREAKFAKREISVDVAIAQEVATKKPFIDLVSVCSGSRQATFEERQLAINELFEMIVRLRSSDRIDGNFMPSLSAEIEKRLSTLEQDLNETNNLVKEIVEYLRNRLQKEKPS